MIVVCRMRGSNRLLSSVIVYLHGEVEDVGWLVEDDLRTEVSVPVLAVSNILRFAELSTGMVRRIVM